ncbi:HEAT repeat domain-containing protein [Planctomicrobium sp. SH661]|uniref:HEAT repeat domain-containing protein n=1 Tax=Planctomicrobium sp. SH661 TaxID=3448124 RepID=UPI003F5BB55B
MAGGPVARLDETTREALIQELRAGLTSQTGWKRIHVAESLIRQGDSTVVRQAFVHQIDSTEPKLRIGIWRVLAQSSQNEVERKAMTGRIRDAFMDRNGPDRVHAAESLGKLGYVPTPKERAAFEEVISGDDPDLSAYAIWVLARSGDAADRKRLVSLLDSDQSGVRLIAAFAMSLSDSQWSQEDLDQLFRATKEEPADSFARPFLLEASWKLATSTEDESVYREQVRELARSGQPEFRYHAISTLAELGTIEDIPLLKQIRHEENANLTLAAADALLRIDRRMTRRF